MTSLAGGKRISKDSPQIDACGMIDELNAFVGAALLSAQEVTKKLPEMGTLVKVLFRIQQELFNLGAMLVRGNISSPGQPMISRDEILQLEKEIDWIRGQMVPLRSFILPGGTRLNTDLHICRTVCRRAERVCVGLGRKKRLAPEITQYLNRLGDVFFSWSRWANRVSNVPEILWDPNQASSAQGGDSSIP
jgi:cob(I)alamin adenosyltransferase